jgi:branched-chain amino acid transport system substrate-binding protein
MINRILSCVVAVCFVVSALVVVSCGEKPGTKPVTIGAILPLSGNSAQYGKFCQEGFQLALTDINKQGGVKGAPLRVIWEDDQAVPSSAAAAMTKLTTVDKVPIVFGSWASSCVLAQAPIAEANHIPILAEAQSPQIRDAGDYVFRIQPDSRLYLRVLAPYACQKLLLKKLAILYLNNDYGVDQAGVFKNLVEGLGSEVVFEEGFPQGAQDFRTVLTKLKAAAPDGVFVPAYAEAGAILKQAAELGIKTQFLGSAPMESPDVVLTAGKAADGVIYVHHFDPDSNETKVKEFQTNYQAKYGRAPEGYAALAYDAAYVLAQVLGQCDGSRECLKSELYKVQNLPGVSGPTSFDDHGDVIKPIVVRTIREGKFVTIQSEPKQ